MTVSELMAKLSQFAPDDEVKVHTVVENPMRGAGFNIGNVYQIIGHDKASGVYIEIFG